MESLPEKPSVNDCCGSGCHPCVFDVYEKLLENAGSVTSESPAPQNSIIRHDLLSPLKYKPFILSRVEIVNEITNLYCFRPVVSEKFPTPEKSITDSDGDDIFGILPYLPGQHVIMINSKENSCNSSVSRAYTPVSVAKLEKNCDLKLLVKCYENGAMSSFIRQLNVRDVVFFRGPFGNFTHVSHSKYVMFCAGTGVAPMVPIIQTILSNEDDETMMRLCFACSTSKDIFFRERIRRFSRYWNFEAHIYLSNESDEQITEHSTHDEKIYSKKISQNVVKERIFSTKHRVLICGSDSFNEDIRGSAELCGCDDIFIF